MSGGYSPATKVGNWSEEKQERERTLARLLAQRAAGTLAADVHAARVAAGNAHVPSAARGGDGVLRTGEPLLLVSSTGGALAACIHDALGPPDAPACASALAATDAPVARATFTLEPVAARSVEDEASAMLRVGGPGVVHYGEKVRVRLHVAAAAAATPPLAPGVRPVLTSQPVSLGAVAKLSKHQLVSWAMADTTHDSIWRVAQVLTPDPAMQLASEGQPVLVGAPVLMRHVATQQCLCAEAQACATDFGTEREVSAWTVTGAGHRDALLAASQSKPEHDVVKPVTDANVWRFA